ncbi:hypothetical protein GCM10010524_00430 [Streptomyces mexicanus]
MPGPVASTVTASAETLVAVSRPKPNLATSMASTSPGVTVTVQWPSRQPGPGGAGDEGPVVPVAPGAPEGDSGASELCTGGATVVGAATAEAEDTDGTEASAPS